MYRAVISFVMLVAALAPGILAQSGQLRIGEQVRAESPVDFASMTRLDVKRDGGSRTARILRNAAAGLLVGAAGGAIAGPLVWSKDCYAATINPERFAGCVEDLADGERRLQSTIAFGVAGTLIGGIIGALLGPDEHWEPVSLDIARVAVVPTANGGIKAGLWVPF